MKAHVFGGLAFRALALLLAGGALAACQPSADPAAQEAGAVPAAQCGADRLQSRIGKPLDGFTKSDWPAPYRIEAPDSLQTMDYRPERLRVRTDSAGQITDLLCG